MKNERYEQLLYQKIRVGTKEQLFDSVRARLGNGGRVSTVNPIILAEAMKNAELFEALRASLNIPDGVGIKKALKKRGAHTEVLPGVELCERLMPFVNSFAIIGAKPGVAVRAAAYLEGKGGSAKCIFTRDGFSYDKSELKRLLSALAPELVLVCLGSPKQELLIKELYPSSEKSLFIGLGGSADVYAGNIKRAPAVFRKMEIEWLWRMLREPKRLRKLPQICDFIQLSGIEKRERCQKAELNIPKSSRK